MSAVDNQRVAVAYFVKPSVGWKEKPAIRACCGACETVEHRDCPLEFLISSNSFKPFREKKTVINQQLTSNWVQVYGIVRRLFGAQAV
jgi:hypothetical protein